MEHFVAIDNVCAWPNLTLLADETILAIIYNQPSHAMWEGDVECWASGDGGRQWVRRGVAARHEPTTNRMNVAAGLAHDGAMIVLHSGWSHRVRPGETPTHERCGPGKVLPTRIARSRDGGRTWEAGGELSPPGGAAYLVPYGDVVRAEGQSLAAAAYHEHQSFFCRSDDDGRSWRMTGPISLAGHNETALLYLGAGRWLAAARTNGSTVDLFDSEDDGRSWTCRGPLSSPGQHPAHLLRLADGGILLTFGSRVYGLRGVMGRLSKDDGRTWSWPFVLVHLDDANFDCGYPATVQLGNGSLVTAYYTAGTRWHSRYHMGVLRWAIEDRLTRQWY